MSRRHSSSESDSLELLLDTICNVFGGVIFIAMLVAVLTSFRAAAVMQEDPPVGTESAMPDVDSIRHRIAQYQLANDALQADRALLATPEAIENAEIIVELDRMLREALVHEDNLRAWLATEAQSREIRQERSEKRWLAAKESVEQLRRDVITLQDAQVERLRLPVQRETRKTQVLLYFHRNRIHGIPLGLADGRIMNQFRRDVTVRPIPGGHSVAPIPGGGFTDDGPLQEVARFRQLLAVTAPRRHFFDLFVDAHSVEAFGAFKHACVERGYSYNVHPIDTEPPLMMGPTDRVFNQ